MSAHVDCGAAVLALDAHGHARVCGVAVNDKTLPVHVFAPKYADMWAGILKSADMWVAF